MDLHNGIIRVFYPVVGSKGELNFISSASKKSSHSLGHRDQLDPNVIRRGIPLDCTLHFEEMAQILN